MDLHLVCKHASYRWKATAFSGATFYRESLDPGLHVDIIWHEPSAKKTPSQSAYTPQGISTPSLYVFSRFRQQSMLQNLLMSSIRNIYDMTYDMRAKSRTGQGSWMLKFQVLQIHLANLPLELLLARCNMTYQPAAPEETAGVASGRV